MTNDIPILEIYSGIFEDVNGFFEDSEGVSCNTQSTLCTYPLKIKILVDDVPVELNFGIFGDSFSYILKEENQRVPDYSFTALDTTRVKSLAHKISGMICDYVDFYAEKNFKLDNFIFDVQSQLLGRLKELNELGFSSVGHTEAWTDSGEIMIKAVYGNNPLVFSVALTRLYDYSFLITTECVSSPLHKPTRVQSKIPMFTDFYVLKHNLVQSAMNCIGRETVICRLMGDKYFH